MVQGLGLRSGLKLTIPAGTMYNEKTRYPETGTSSWA